MSDHRAEPTQDGPRMDMHEASDADKADGIVAQTAQDLAGQPDDIVRDAVAQRFEQSEVPATDDELDTHTENVQKRVHGE